MTRRIFNRKAKHSEQDLVFNNFKTFFPNILFEFNVDGKFEYLNQHGLTFFGLSDTNIKKGISIEDIFPDHFGRMQQMLIKIKGADDVITEEYLINDSNGKPVTSLFKISGIFSGKNLVGYRGVITDISNQKDTETQIIKEKAFFESMFDHSPEATAIIDIKGKIIRVNLEFTKLFGFSADEAINQEISELIFIMENRAEFIRPELFSSNKPKIEKEIVLKEKSGKRLNIDLSAAAVTVDGKAIAYTLSFRNVSRERLFHMLQEAVYNISSLVLDLPTINDIYPIICHELNNVWHSENFFIALTDDNNETLTLPYFIDEKDQFETIPFKKTLTGWLIGNRKPVLLRKKDIQELEKQDLIDQVGSDCEIWMGAPIEAGRRIIGAICIQDYNDENRYTDEDLGLLDYAAKHIAISIDRRMLLDSMRDAKKQAEEIANSKQLFLSTMSHEIRTPLNEVIGIANILLQENLRPDHVDYIRSLLFSGNHLLTLVNDVLDFSKIDAGKIDFENIPFSLKNYLDDLKKSYAIRANTKHLNFELVKGDSIPEYVIGDQVRLNQVLSNLFSNSLKFTREGGIKIIVNEIKRTDNKSCIEFRVEDTGIGIQAEKLGTIFDTFTQASKSTNRQYGGSGLGLTISKRIVELLGGTLNVDSSYGNGTAFSFKLEFRLHTNIESGEKAIVENPELLAGKRILIAEDNKINFMVANKILSARGMVVSHAENGKKAVEMLEKQYFDLVLMDLHMPEMDGIEATRIIRNSSNVKINNIPIIALTAVSLSDCKDRISDIRFDSYILKPFKPESLFGTISRLLS